MFTLLILLATILLLTQPTEAPAADDVIEWTRQFGTSNPDQAFDTATDSTGNVYVVGDAKGVLPDVGGSQGYEDAFVRKYDPSGNIVWTRQFGTANYDTAGGAATDAAGNVYVAGDTAGVLPDGGGAQGNGDAFVRKYDPSGGILWTRQFGSSFIDDSASVATDVAGNVLVVGDTEGAFPDGGGYLGEVDGFVRKYDSSGNIKWTSQFGTSETDYAKGVATDVGGNVYVAGDTHGALTNGGGAPGNGDAFVRKHDPSGNILWTRQFGSYSHSDFALAAATDASSNVYVVGFTYDALLGTGGSQGYIDAFVRKYDPSGNILWTRQFGTAGDDYAKGAATDLSGNIYVAGFTYGALPGGGGSQGNYDAYVRKYDYSGNIVWTRQFGTASPEYAYGAATAAAGNVYVVGDTDGALPGGGSQGAGDAYVMKFRGGLAAYYVTPNPFSPNFDGVEDTQGFVFTLTKSANVIIRVSNYKGVVRTVYGGPFIKNGVIHNEYFGPGLHTVGWTGTDDNGKVLPVGNYRYEIIARNGTETASGTGIAAITPVSSASN